MCVVRTPPLTVVDASAPRSVDGIALPHFLIALYICATLQGPAAANNPKIELFTGTYFEPIQNIFPYTSTIPLLYKIKFNPNVPLPQFNSSLNFCLPKTNKSTANCAMKNNLWTLQNQLHEQMAAEQEFFGRDSETPREKRSLAFIGSFFSWCCGLIDEEKLTGIVQNEEDLTTHTNDLIDMVSTEHKDLVVASENLNNFTKNVEQLSEKVHSSLKTMQEEINALAKTDLEKQLYSLIQQSWIYTYYNYYHDNLREIRRQCNSHSIPEMLIPKQTLLTDLTKIQNSATQKNLSLAIPLDQLHAYFNLPLTTCIITKNSILIKIKVPLKRNFKYYKAYFNVPTPLHWEEKICYLSKEKSIIIKTETSTHGIHHQDQACNELTLPLCLIPRETINSEPSLRCLQQIISGATLTTLKTICEYTCYPKYDFPIITKILSNKYLITNINDQLTLSCPNKSSHLPLTTSGTLEILLPCNCSIYDNSTELITTLAPCDSNDFSSSKVTHLLPITWTKFQSLTIFPLDSNIRHEFDHMKEILNQNWTLTTPTYFVHSVVKQDTLEHFKLKNTYADIVNNTEFLIYLFLGWIIILTFLVLFLFYCIHIQHLKLKMLSPSVREQPVVIRERIRPEDTTNARLI